MVDLVRTPEGYRPPATGGGSITSTGVIYVSTTGDDGTAAPYDPSRPYRTIAAALAIAAAGNVVEVWPGNYPEQGLIMPNDVALVGLAWEATRIGPASTAATADVLTMGDGCTLEQLAFNIPSAAGLAAIRYTAGAGQTSVANFLTFYGDAGAGASAGVGFVMSGGPGKLIGDVWRLEGGGCESMARVDSAVLALGGIHCPQSAGPVAAFTDITGGRIQLVSTNAGNTNCAAAHRASGGTTRIFTVNWFQVPVGLRVTADPVDIEITGGDIDPSSLAVLIDAGLTGVGSEYLISATVSPLFSFPPAYAQQASYIVLAQQKDAPTRDAAQRVFGADFSAGFPERGSSVTAGEQGPYADKIVVATTDATAGPTSDGGNIIDRTAQATDKTSTGTLAFQALTGAPAAGPTILWGSLRQDGAGVPLPHFAVQVRQDARAQDGAGNAPPGTTYQFEIWADNGVTQEWRPVLVQSSRTTKGTSYAYNVFGRDGSDETLRLGIGSDGTILSDPDWSWTSKTINIGGTPQTSFFARVRLVAAVTVGPTFTWFQLCGSFTTLDRVGRRQAVGLALWETTYVAAGNIWGNTAGIGNFTAQLGAGAFPAGAVFNVGRSLLNGTGDRLDIQLVLPEGFASCIPVLLRVVVGINGATGGAPIAINTAPELTAALFPIEAASVRVADPAGGVDLVPRTYANTGALAASTSRNVGAVALIPEGETLPYNATDKLFEVEFGPLSLDALYPGDLAGVVLEFTTDATPTSVDVQIWAIELVGYTYEDGLGLE